MNKITIIILIILSLCSVNAYANTISTNFDEIIEGVATSPYFDFIGSSLDNLMDKIKDSLLPGIFTLTKNNNTSVISIVRPNSFVGILINVLLVFECLFFGIKSFFTEEINAFSLIKKTLQILVLLIFISSVNIIGESIINIFITAGRIATGADINNTSFYPSTILSTFSLFKNIIDVTRIGLGGFSLSNIIDILILSLSTIIVALPFLFSAVMFIFYYVEYILIILSSTVVLPLSFFEYTSLTSVKNIIKSIILQGIKIFIVVFFSSILQKIIEEEINDYFLRNIGVINVVLYLLLFSLIYLFGITEGGKIVTSVINGEMSKSSPLKSGFLLSLPFATIPSLFKTHNKNSTSTVDKKIDTPQVDTPLNDGNQTQPPNPDIDTKPPQSKQPTEFKSSSNNFKYLTKATAPRISDAYNSFIKEGVKDVTVDEVKDRARWDSTFQKLKSMKSENMSEDEKKLFEDMKKDKQGYVNGTHTFRGEKCQNL